MGSGDCPVIWRYCDGKRGHENQSAGLVQALAGLSPLVVHDVLLTERSCSAGDARRPDPTLIIGAGHTTHLAMLRARRMHGGRVIVLMRPSLPRRCFDLCIVPAHDGLRPRADTLITRGVLNCVRPATRRTPDAGLMLIGGPSKHHAWDDARIVDQIATIAASRRRLTWRVAASRRTPPSLLPAVVALHLANLEVVPMNAVASDWLASQLALAGEVWVTGDSVSMIYEALSGGAGVGLIEVPARTRRLSMGRDRVLAGLDELIGEKWVTPFAAWDRERALPVPAAPLDEARRCADWIVEHWLDRTN